MTIGTVNIETGQYTTFGNNNCAFGEELANAALCSSSIPIVFPPNHFQGQYYMDGGTTWNINVSSAVNGCKSLGFDEAHITVDVFICGGSTDIDPKDEIGHTLNNFRRARKINDYYNNVDAI